MTAPSFPSVSTNQEKYLSYKAQMARLKKARAEGFYLEAIFILYAMLEDRLSAFLYHAGATNNTREKLTTNKQVRKHLDQISLKPNQNVKKISAKVSLMKTLICWSDVYTPEEASKTYPDLLCKQLRRSARKDEIVQSLEDIEAWCGTRNELVHALLKKRLEDQEEALIALVERGVGYCRCFDNFVDSFKLRNTLRRQFNIQ
ncbi:MAG TPA: hypothetical protein PLO92_08930 [Anaerolineaceae bacterium]|mgnify:CR=1 FL=1|jgi:hypothetical protein|nr:hypothetical protein [Anaerolineaceae bacterium]HPY34116.1 hypothetical protein [Anaerolineaceae bacterium]HQC21937.1 hypothetical protein [Anaerolineaceae bacterium]